MRKFFTVVTLAAVLAFGTVAFAQMWGGGPGYGMGPGYGGGHMRGQGYGMGYGMGYGGGPGAWGNGEASEEFNKVLDETADLRKSMHDKRFEWMEAVRAGDTAKAEILEAEVIKLRQELADKFSAVQGDSPGYGGGPGYGCPGPFNR